MIKPLAPVFLGVYVLLSGITGTNSTEVASSKSSNGSLNLYIYSQRKNCGEWVTTFATSRDIEDSTKTIDLDMNHNVVEIGEKKFMQIRGVLRDSPVKKTCIEDLKFNSANSKNIEIQGNGKVATRKNWHSEWKEGAAFTNRPLLREEMFEVLIVSNVTKWSDEFDVGITAVPPQYIVFPTRMSEHKKDTWLMYQQDTYKNGEKIKTKFGRDLSKLRAGDRVGLVVKNDDTLHIFVNGVDLGSAADNIPETVYGFVDVIANVVSVVIIDKSS